MILDDVHRGIQRHPDRKRVGRGRGSGQGCTAGRGNKGAKSRSGYRRRTMFEGGQMPLARRIAKRGFSNAYFADKVATVNLKVLEKLFQDGDVVDAAALAARGLAKGPYDVVKILGDGELTRRLTVRAHRFSKSAEEKITARGGTAEVVAAR